MRQALQDDVENTAGFAGFDHVGGKIVKHLGILPHGVGERRAAFDRRTDSGQASSEMSGSPGWPPEFPDTAPEAGRRRS